MNFLSKNVSLQKSLSAILLYIAIALLAISDSGIQLLILIEIGPGSRTLRLIALWLLFLKVLFTRYTKKEFFILAPLSVLAMYNYHISGNIFCIYTILLIAASKDIDYSILFKTLFYSTLATIVTLGILSFWNIGSPTKLVEERGHMPIPDIADRNFNGKREELQIRFRNTNAIGFHVDVVAPAAD